MNLNNYKKINKKQKLINNNKPNNIHIFSTINDYWEKREKENKIKINIIKRERDEKKYGDVYRKPKINKNTEAIINRIKKNINNKILEEEQIEDQINRNIPIRTEKRSTYFKNNYKTCKNKNYKKINNITITFDKTNKINKNNYRIDPKDSYVRLIKIRNN